MSRVSRVFRRARATLLGVLILALGWLLVLPRGPEVYTVPPARLELPPGAAEAVFETAAGTDWLGPYPDLVGAIRRAGSRGDAIAGLRDLCGAIRLRMPRIPQFPRSGERWVRRRALAPEEVLLAWTRGEEVDPFSVACLTARLATLAGMPARVVLGEGADWPGSRGFAGVEIWSERQWSWLLADPCIGLAFNTSDRFLSALGVRRALLGGEPPATTPLVQAVADSRFERRALAYADRIRNLWIPLNPEGPSVASDPDAGWVLIDDALARTWPWQPASLAAKLFRRIDPRGVALPRSFPGWLVVVLLGSYLLGLAPELAAAATGRTLGDAIRGIRGDLDRLTRLAGAALESVRATLGLPSRAAAALSGAWARVRTSRGRETLPGPFAGALLDSPRSRRVGLLAAAALVLLALHLSVANGVCEEDAYITFRFVRNWVSGEGLTFNPGEPGVEGFSNTLWLFLLAAGARLGGDPVAMAWGGCLLIGALHVVAVAWIGARCGPFAWLPLLLLATSSAYAAACASGLETALVALLITLAGWSWAREDRRTGSGVTTTSLLCFCLALARPEGAAFFVALSAARLVESRGAPPGRLIRQWLLPFGALFTLYTIWRVWTFGALVPHIYEYRVVGMRGAFPERLLLGLRYLSGSLAGNLALAAGLLGIASSPRSPVAARLSVVVLAQLAIVAIVGGDADYMRHSRFLVHVAGPIALLAQQVVLGAGPSRPGRVRRAFALAALIVAGNAVEIEAPLIDVTPALSPLARTVASGWPAAASAVTGGARLALDLKGDAMQSSFDGFVGRHMAASGSPEQSLACVQAGQIAYLWPGKFIDIIGLTTAPPEPYPLAPAIDRLPDRYLISRELGSDWRSLRRRGYRIERVYVDLVEGNEQQNTDCYVSLGLQAEGTLELGQELFLARYGKTRMAWWRLPRDRLVIRSSPSS